MSMFSKLKQIKDLRDQAKKMQEEMSQQVAEGSTDWGKVKIKLDGNMQVLNVFIDDALLGNKAKIESGVREALQNAMKEVQKMMIEKMRASGTLPDLLGGTGEASDVQE